ncbi:hypothetical protein LSH36_193g09010 [Paralvinella palmiformis]|uniref:Guanylate cyclase domain-containing protein n=1 Tax=Paralvinella palmiformis TaxID=53620 RepID=A0AAD9JQI7_9ANNE|nr:hypothetical protein LSH36_193g09010 [Paralvinella palmiformis]
MGFPFTQWQQRKLLIKVVAAFTLPTVILLAVTSFYIIESSLAINMAIQDMNAVQNAGYLDRMAYAMQEERDNAMVFMSAASPQTTSYLFDQYKYTDYVIVSTPWPNRLDVNSRPEYTTKMAFQIYISNHRNARKQPSNTMFMEMDFYTEVIKTLILWLNGALVESKTSERWKQMVAYENVIACQEIASIERSLGVYYFTNGGFDDKEQLKLFTTQINIFDSKYSTARQYSDIVPAFSKSDVIVDGQDLGVTIQRYRNEIIHGQMNVSSLPTAYDWLDKTSLYLDYLRDIQNRVKEDVILGLKMLVNNEMEPIFGGICILIIISIVYPLMVRNINRAIKEINDYTEMMLNQCNALDEEKKRSDSLLCKMLPPSIADDMKNGGRSKLESFSHITVFFSSIVNFNDLVERLTPKQLITFLNNVFKQIDTCIDKYDAYKVETIGDICVVTSGLPKRNKNNATEIANLALDIINTVFQAEIEDGFIVTFRFRMGISSGAAMGGIVGTQTLQYCVFGDTMNIASRMSSHGLPNTIHMSSNTRQLLKRTGRYVIESRGLIDIKGKGQMATYLLVGRNDCLGHLEISVPGRDGDTPRHEIPCFSGAGRAHDKDNKTSNGSEVSDIGFLRLETRNVVSVVGDAVDGGARGALDGAADGAGGGTGGGSAGGGSAGGSAGGGGGGASFVDGNGRGGATIGGDSDASNDEYDIEEIERYYKKKANEIEMKITSLEMLQQT